jgi:hypothetical protein
MPTPELLDLPDDVTHFYRYSSTAHLEWLKPVILEHRIYMPSAKELNDPRECRPRFIRLTRPEIRRFLMRSHRERNPLATLEELARAWGEIDWLLVTSSAERELEYLSSILYERTERTRVFSMSKRWNNLAMWAKYADDHRGYCLEFARVGFFTLARPVLYDDSKRLDLRSHLDDVKFAWSHYKSPDWSNEEEIRVVLPPSIQAEPWREIEPEGLKRILLGKDMRAVDRAQIQQWAAERTPSLPVMDVVFSALTQELTLVSASR